MFFGFWFLVLGGFFFSPWCLNTSYGSQVWLTRVGQFLGLRWVLALIFLLLMKSHDSQAAGGWLSVWKESEATKNRILYLFDLSIKCLPEQALFKGH